MKILLTELDEHGNFTAERHPPCELRRIRKYCNQITIENLSDNNNDDTVPRDAPDNIEIECMHNKLKVVKL